METPYPKIWKRIHYEIESNLIILSIFKVDNEFICENVVILRF